MSSQSTKIDRTQTRFIEDCNRFDNPNTKPKRNTHKSDVTPQVGHQSTNPGPWVTEIVLGLTESTEEQRESAEAILESYYRLRSRYVTLKYPVVVRGQLWEKELPATEFREETVLDNKSLCFGTATREPKDESDSFKYVNQPNVLAGAKLQKYLAGKKSLVTYSNDKDHEREHGKIERKSKRKQKAEAAKAKVAPVVPDAEMLAHYSHWYENPSDDSKATFWEAW